MSHREKVIKKSFYSSRRWSSKTEMAEKICSGGDEATSWFWFGRRHQILVSLILMNNKLAYLIMWILIIVFFRRSLKKSRVDYNHGAVKTISESISIKHRSFGVEYEVFIFVK